MFFARIDESNVVKVADFGLTRNLYESLYYRTKDRKAKLPIKWMALESLERCVFTIKTDVVSYQGQQSISKASYGQQFWWNDKTR